MDFHSNGIKHEIENLYGIRKAIVFGWAMWHSG